MGYALSNKMGDRYVESGRKYFVVAGNEYTVSTVHRNSPPTVFNGKICLNAMVKGTATYGAKAPIFDFTYTGSPTTVPDITVNTCYALPAAGVFNSYWVVSAHKTGGNSLEATNSKYGTYGFEKLGYSDFTVAVTAGAITVTPKSMKVYDISDTFVETVKGTFTTAINITNDGSYATNATFSGDCFLPFFTRKNGVVVLGLMYDTTKVTSLPSGELNLSGKVICLTYNQVTNAIDGRLLNIPTAIPVRTSGAVPNDGGSSDDSLVGGTYGSAGGEGVGLNFDWTANTITVKTFNLLNSSVSISNGMNRVNFSRNLAYYKTWDSTKFYWNIFNDVSHNNEKLPVVIRETKPVINTAATSMWWFADGRECVVTDPATGDLYAFSDAMRCDKTTYTNYKTVLEVIKYSPVFDDPIRDLSAANGFNFKAETTPLFWNSDKSGRWGDTSWFVFDSKFFHVDTWSSNRVSLSRFSEPSNILTNVNETVIDDVSKRQYVSNAACRDSSTSYNNPTFYYDTPTRELVSVVTRSNVANVTNKPTLSRALGYEFRIIRVDRNGCQRFEDFTANLSFSSWASSVSSAVAPTASSVIGSFNINATDGNGLFIVSVLHDVNQTTASGKWLAFVMFNYRNKLAYLVVKTFTDSAFNPADLGNMIDPSWGLINAMTLPWSSRYDGHLRRLVFSNSWTVSGGSVDFKPVGEVVFNSQDEVYAVAGMDNLYFNKTQNRVILTDSSNNVLKSVQITNPNTDFDQIFYDQFSSTLYVVENVSNRTINGVSQAGSKISRMNWYSDKSENLYWNMSGTTKRVNELYVNVNNEATKVTELYYNDNGTVRRLF